MIKQIGEKMNAIQLPDMSFNTALFLEERSQLPANPMVSICCITYNHKNFIVDAIESFLMQKTNFPIEILIHDDASDDGTANIVREYENNHSNLIRAVYQTENQYSKGKKVTHNLYNIARGKYIAFCEGDDYWTDPLKLQKQIDFLEAHPTCSICFHKVLRMHEGHKNESYYVPDILGDKIFTKDDIYSRHFIQTCSVVIRNMVTEEYINFAVGMPLGDYALLCYYAQLGDIGFLDDVMATYRIHQGGVWTMRSYAERERDAIDTRLKIKERLNIIDNDIYDKATLSRMLRILRYFIKTYDLTMLKKYLKMAYPYLRVATMKRKFEILTYSVLVAFPPMLKIYSDYKKYK